MESREVFYCDHCGSEDVVGTIDHGLYYCVRHEARVRATHQQEDYFPTVDEAWADAVEYHARHRRKLR